MLAGNFKAAQIGLQTDSQCVENSSFTLAVFANYNSELGLKINL